MTGRFVHQTWGYGSDDEFVSIAVSFIRAGLAAGEPVLATTSAANLELIGQSLGDDAMRVDVTESGNFGRRAPERVAAFHRYWREHATPGGRVRILAEPPWPGWAPRELDAWIRMEAGLNLVLADTNVSMICPYDTRAVSPSMVSSSHRTHPLISDSTGARSSVEYADPVTFAAEWDEAATPEPAPDDAAKLELETRNPRQLREFAAQQAGSNGLDGERAELFIFAVNELATYLSREAAAQAVVRIWPSADSLDCELDVANGFVPEPFAGFQPPDDIGAHPDDRLWIARQICDSLEIRPTASGSTARLSFAGAPSPAQAQTLGVPLA